MPNNKEINGLFGARQNAQIITIAGTETAIYSGNNIVRAGSKSITDISREGGYA